MKSFYALLSLLIHFCHSSADAQAPVPGMTPVSTMVGENGQAVVSIPLMLPKGNIVSPSFGLTYNSQAKDWLAGPGVSLDGLVRSITRMPATYAGDGFSSAKVNDPFYGRYALDGEPLKAVFYYSSEYTGLEMDSYLWNARFSEGMRTEAESFSRVIVYSSGKGSQLNDASFYADSFRVYHKDGLVYDFGCTPDSRIELAGTQIVNTWLLNKVSDHNGNYFIIRYLKNAGNSEFYPLEVLYTGNSRINLLPYNRISFQYESRPDSLTHYLSGYPVKFTKRLQSVACYDHGQLLRRYVLGYAMPASGTASIARSQLEKVIEFGVNGQTAYRPVTFTWQRQPSVAGFIKPGSGMWNGHAARIANTVVGDFNGDGKHESAGYTGQNGLWHVSLSTGTGFTNSFWQAHLSTGSTNLAADVNGDLKSDLLGYSGGRWHVSLSTGSGFVTTDWSGAFTGPAFSKFYVIDANNDGRKDVLCYGGGGNWHEFISTGSAFTHRTYNDGCKSCNGTVLTGNFNGDGITDVLNATRLSSFTTASITNSFVADVNGDGYDDLVSFLGNSQWKVGLSVGNPFIHSFTFFTWTAHNNGLGNNCVADVNADGMADLITYVGGTGYGVYLSTGRAYQYAGIWKGHAGGLVNNLLFDANGDGNQDLVGYSGVNGKFDVALSNSENEAVIQVTSGYGISNGFVYAPLTKDGIHQRSTSGKYPDVDFSGALPVVVTASTDDGLGGFRREHFTYADAKLNLRGRGLRGFGKVTITDSLKNTITTTWYNTDYRSVYTRPYRCEVRTLGNVLLNKTENHIAVRTLRFAKDSTFFSYCARTVDSSFELNGKFIKSKTTDNTVDAVGNVTRMTETYSNGYKVTTETTYFRDDDKWLLTLPLQTTITAETPGKPAVTKDFNYTYNNTGGLIREVSLRNHATLRLQTDYTLDVFGNRIAVTVSGPGITVRKSTMQYDSEGRNLIAASDPLGRTTTTRYRYGLPDTLTDANGLATVITRDPMGRVGAKKFPDGTVQTFLFFECTSYPSLCQGNGAYIVKEQMTGRPALYTVFDKLNRPVRTANESFRGATIYRDRVYNRDGTLQKESAPSFALPVSAYTSFSYDILKRVTQQTEPSGAATSYLYEGLSKTIVDPSGKRTTKVENEQGKLVKAVDAAGAVLSFEYDAALNLLSTIDPHGNKIVMQYDLRDNKIYMKDPDMGEFRYQFNALSQLVKETNPKGENISYSYNLNGDIVQRAEKEGLVEWKYDGPNGKGKVHQIFQSGQLKRQDTYDGLSRLSKKDYFVNGQQRSFHYTYDAGTGLLSFLSYPNSMIVHYTYDGGQLAAIIAYNLRKTGIPIWTANAYNAYNQATSFTLGNNVVIQKTFDARSNLLTEIKSGYGSGNGALQNHRYQYNLLGDLVNRQDINFGLSETFEYDTKARLTQSTIRKAGMPGSTDVRLRYDALDNIVYKSDVGTYRYGEAGKGPHVLTSIDHSGIDSCIYGLNQTISYTSYNYVSKIISGVDEIHYTYGPEQVQETQVVKKQGTIVKTKTNFSELYEEHISRTNDTTCSYFIKAGSEVVAIGSGPRTMFQKKDSITYLLKDHLGSVCGFTDETGKIKQLVSHDAWGRPRDPGNWRNYKTVPAAQVSDRGFTFHQETGIDFLVSMGARVYNPVLGRFISPDPFIQFPDNLASYNRFSYVLNSPLNYTDPTGYFSLKKFFKRIIPIAVSVFLTTSTSGLFGIIGAGATGGFGAGFTSGILNGQGIGGSLKMGLQSGIQGGITAGAMAGIDKAFPSLLTMYAKEMSYSPLERFGNQFANSVLRSAVNGSMAAAGGSSFSKGFYNSMFWEGVGALNAEIIINNSAYEKRSLYDEAHPTFKRGVEKDYQRPAFKGDVNHDPYFLSKTPIPNNIGLDWHAGVRDPNFLTNGSSFMSAVNTLFPGMQYHANMHDPMVSMLYKTSNFFRDNPFGKQLANIPTQVVVISNYGTILNHYGLLNTYQNAIK